MSGISDKIRALMVKAEGKGTTPEEAQAFMAKAQELMTKHGIESISLDDPEHGKVRPLHIIEVEHNPMRGKYDTDAFVAPLVDEFCGVQILSRTTMERVPHPDRMWEKRWKTRKTFFFVGDALDIPVAIEVFESMTRIMRALLKSYLKTSGQKYLASTVNSFLTGVYFGFIDANQMAKKQAVLDAGETGKAYQLAVVDKDAAVDHFIKSNIKTVRPRAGTGMGARSGTDYMALMAGKEAGRKLNPKAKRLNG